MPNSMGHPLRAIVLAAAGAGLLGLAGCTATGGPIGGATSGPATATAPGTGTPTETSTAAAGAACDLLTPDDVAAATGRQVGSPVSRSVAGASVCQFDDVVVTRLRSPVTADQFDLTVHQVASAASGQVTPITGVGQAAAYIALLKEICVVQQPTFFCIAGADQAASQQLAQKAVTRL